MNKGKIRIEVVALLALGAVVAWVALGPAGGPEDEARRETQGAVAGQDGETPVIVRRCVLERDFGNARLDIDVRLRNDTAQPLAPQPPAVRLLAGSDGEREVPPFFLPTERPAEVPPQSAAEVKLRYWLETNDLAGPLVLEVSGQRVPVKSAAPLDLAGFENGKPVTFADTEWSAGRE